MSAMDHRGIVYSSEYGRMCPVCARPQNDCLCKEASRGPKGDGNVRVGRETKGRKGKGVTVITGLPLDDKGLQSLSKQLKRHCGAGGTVREGVIEIQGDHRDLLVDLLIKQGYDAKRSGG